MDDHTSLPGDTAPAWTNFTLEEKALVEEGSAEIAAGRGLPYKIVSAWLKELDHNPAATLPDTERCLPDRLK